MRSERFPDLGDEVLFPRHSDSKLEWLAKQGVRRSFQIGDVLYEHADRDAPFYAIERGLVELVDRKPGKDVHIAEIDSHTFIGDIGRSQESRRSARASQSSRRTSSSSTARACATCSRAGPSSASTSSRRCWPGGRGTWPRGTE